MNMNFPGDGAAVAKSLTSEPDAHGQAALLLAESTLHMLVEADALTVSQAVEVVRTAYEVKIEVATMAGESEGRMQASLDLLERIERSIAADGHTPDPNVRPALV